MGLHQECDYDYHRVVHGVILNDKFEINAVRKSRKALKRVPNGSSRIRYMRQSKDLQAGYSCESEGSQDERLGEGEIRAPRADQVQHMSADEDEESLSGESGDCESEAPVKQHTASRV